MLYWECKKRLQSLREFRSLAEAFFQAEAGEGVPIRTRINQHLGYVLQSLAKVGHSSTIYYSPPPLIGGFAGPVNVLSNMFRLSDYQVEEQIVFDVLDGAIGKYERHLDWLSKQRFNPLFWVRWLLTRFLRIPFMILGAAGFDAEKAEASLFGKIIKAVVGLVFFLAALLQILDYLQLLPHLRRLLGPTAP